MHTQYITEDMSYSCNAKDLSRYFAVGCLEASMFGSCSVGNGLSAEGLLTLSSRPHRGHFRGCCRTNTRKLRRHYCERPFTQSQEMRGFSHGDMGVHAPCVQPPMSRVDSRSGGRRGELGSEGTTTWWHGHRPPVATFWAVDPHSQRQGRRPSCRFQCSILCVFLDGLEEPGPSAHLRQRVACTLTTRVFWVGLHIAYGAVRPRQCVSKLGPIFRAL
ncbi:hypothetical protein BC826DRAFT_738928 [Russula brevipes]|nr:hypothetical protein BC826DRAFT_738928 [Russula brevipes]